MTSLHFPTTPTHTHHHTSTSTSTPTSQQQQQQTSSSHSPPSIGVSQMTFISPSSTSTTPSVFFPHNDKINTNTNTHNTHTNHTTPSLFSATHTHPQIQTSFPSSSTATFTSTNTSHHTSFPINIHHDHTQAHFADDNDVEMSDQKLSSTGSSPLSSSRTSTTGSTTSSLSSTSSSASSSSSSSHVHIPPSPHTQPKRSILKIHTGKRRSGIVWDEGNLEQNEREKVPRMKIDEPDTPYHPPQALSPDHRSAMISQMNKDTDEVSSLDLTDSKSATSPLSRQRPSSFVLDAAAQRNGKLTQLDSENIQQISSEALLRRGDDWDDTSSDDDALSPTAQVRRARMVQSSRAMHGTDASPLMEHEHDEDDMEDGDEQARAAKKAAFEMKRKQHYHPTGEALRHPVVNPLKKVEVEEDEDDDEEETNDEDDDAGVEIDGIQQDKIQT